MTKEFKELLDRDAAGELTPEEGRRLHDAMMVDQDLFDEAEEQAAYGVLSSNPKFREEARRHRLPEAVPFPDSSALKGTSRKRTIPAPVWYALAAAVILATALAILRSGGRDEGPTVLQRTPVAPTAMVAQATPVAEATNPPPPTSAPTKVGSVPTPRPAATRRPLPGPTYVAMLDPTPPPPMAIPPPPSPLAAIEPPTPTATKLIQLELALTPRQEALLKKLAGEMFDLPLKGDSLAVLELSPGRVPREHRWVVRVTEPCVILARVKSKDGMVRNLLGHEAAFVSERATFTLGSGGTTPEGDQLIRVLVLPTKLWAELGSDDAEGSKSADSQYRVLREAGRVLETVWKAGEDVTRIPDKR